METMLHRARRLLGEPNNYHPTGEPIRDKPPAPSVHLFVVPRDPEPPIVDPSDIDGSIASELEKGNLAMTTSTEAPPSLADAYGKMQQEYLVQLNQSANAVKNEMAEANQAHSDNIARIDAMKAEAEADHAEATAEFERRLSDINDTERAVKAAIAALTKPVSHAETTSQTTGTPTPSLDAIRTAAKPAMSSDA